MVLSGVDLVVLDQEHYPFNAQEIEAIVRAVQSFGGECMVRVPNTEPARIAQVMESGVCGVVVPHIETYEEAMEVVNAVKYAPIGKRGFCPITRAAAYGMGMNAKEYANAVLGGKLEYEWDDIIPVACYAKNDTQILIVSGDAPYDNAQELVEYMKENPNTVSFAVTLGSPSHYHAVAFEQASGTSFKKVDIGSGSDKIVAMLSGEVDVVSSTVGIAKDYIASGDVKVIGSLASERSEFAPNIPTLNEQGVDIGDVGFAVYYTVWVKADTPQEIIDALASSIEQMVNDATYQENCANLEFVPLYMGPEEVAEYEQEYYDFLSGMAEAIQNDTF